MSYPKDALTQHVKIEELPEMINYELGRARRYGSPLGLLRVKVKVRDATRRYEIMKRFATCCLSVIRSPDQGYRHGENLLYVLPQTPAEGLATVAGKLYSQLDEVAQEMEGADEVTELTVESVCYTPERGEGKVTPSILLGTFPSLGIDHVCEPAEASPAQLGQLYPSLTITRHPHE